MSDRLAGRVVLVGLAAGFLAQVLFFHQSPGINWPIWICAVIGATLVARRSTAKLDRADAWLPVGAIAFAAFIALRDDPGLLLFDFPASGALTLASVVAIGGNPITRSAWITIGRLGGAAILAFWGGAAHVMHGFRPLLAAAPGLTGSSTSRRVVRGLLIALPLVLAFVVLFAAADAVFQNLLRNALSVDVKLDDWVGRATFGLIAGWLFVGTMIAAWLSRERFLGEQPDAPVTPVARKRVLSAIEAATVLVVLDVLFAIFVVIQAAYLFPGGDPLAASGLTYAEYARRGFFELVVVAFLSGAVILAFDWLVDRVTAAQRMAAAALAVMTGLILVSAYVRLSLYQQAYGWTELRLYVLAAIGLLAFGVVVTLAGIGLKRVGSVPKLVLAAGFVVALLCNVIGTQAFVTAQNLERAANPALVPAGGQSGLDANYLYDLGPDVVPAVLAARNGLAEGDRERVDIFLAGTASTLRRVAADTGWPSWNLSRQAALDALTAAGF
ncbi:MAG: DUF4173 domain-containing protein [Chloroflexota bacterium]